LFPKKTDIFFDLDHTLWDYNRNCEEALHEVYLNYDLNILGIADVECFIKQFHIENNRLWTLYDTRQITAHELRHARFRDVLLALKAENFSISDQLHESYMAISPNKPHLLPGAKAILDYLKTKYRLHIITNGITDNQIQKMKASGIESYFETMVCSQKANARKPEKQIFEYALNQANCSELEAVMIGDNYEVDIVGAINAGIDAIFFQPEKLVNGHNFKNTINHLSEIKNFI
jgi:putative hydrolase of the HAD superfamily